MIPSLKGVLGRVASAVRGSRATSSAIVSSRASRTGSQLTSGSGLGSLGGLASLAPQLPAGYETYRRMRRDPTIALARALAVAPVVAGKWTVEADADVPQEVRGWIDKQFLTVRELLLETILKHGYVDFGHQGFELVWGLDAEGRQCIVRFKPLLPDITEILIDDHGGLAGLRQRDVVLTGVNAMLVSFGGEGSDLHGEPLLENVREVWNDWRKANAVAARYDRKIAGAYLLLHYPSFGQGIDQNGAKLDNVYLAQRILDKLEAASGVAVGDVPSELAPGQDPNQTAWRLEVQGSAGGQQQGFVDRLRYLDSLKVRGMLLPERAILEGQHGTLAESQSQGDLAFLQAELVHHHVTREINRQAVDPVLEANWGPAYRGKVRLEASPLSSDNLGFLRQLVTQVLSDPKDFADLLHRADWPSIFDAVGLPQTKAASPSPFGLSTIASAIGRLQREATDLTEVPTQLQDHRQGHYRARSPQEHLAVQPQNAHIERVGLDVPHLACYRADQPRGEDGKWIKEDSNDVQDPLSLFYPWHKHKDWTQISEERMDGNKTSKDNINKNDRFWSTWQATMERDGQRVTRTYRQVRANTIVVQLVVLGNLQTKAFPPFDVAPEDAGVRVGTITCGGSVYNSGHPNLIKGFPDIRGAIGSGQGAGLKKEREYLAGLNQKQGLHVSTAEQDMNAGKGNSREAFLGLVEEAWTKAVDEAKEMVQVKKASPGDLPGMPTNGPFNPMRVVFAADVSRDSLILLRKSDLA